MFGRMMVTPIAQIGADANLLTAISSLLRAAEQVWRYFRLSYSYLNATMGSSLVVRRGGDVAGEQSHDNQKNS